jgi:HEAT repeat protein
MPEKIAIQIDRLDRGQLLIDEQRSLAADLGSLTDATSEAILISLLGNSDPIVRYNAIIALGFDRGVRLASPILIRMVEDDPDEDCRSASASALGHMFQNTKDRDMLQVLSAAALHDPDDEVRRSAYRGVLIVSGVSPEEHLSLLRDEALLVDPDKVRRILSMNRESAE